MTSPAVIRNRQLGRVRRKRQQLAELHGISLAYIDAQPIRDHTKALETIGWTVQGIVVASGVDGTTQGLNLIRQSRSLKAHPKWRRILRMPLTVAVPPHMPGNMHVPALGAQRRTRALMALGYRHSDLTPAFGGATSSHLAIGLRPLITAETWRAVDTAYRRLSATLGPSETSRARAIRKGYAPPLAWDDIDNPRERPKGLAT